MVDFKKSILTRDVLLKRGGACAKNCLFCGQDESIDHLFLHCPLARYVWNVVSVATGMKCQFPCLQHFLTDWLGGFEGKQMKKIQWELQRFFGGFGKLEIWLALKINGQTNQWR